MVPEYLRCANIAVSELTALIKRNLSEGTQEDDDPKQVEHLCLVACCLVSRIGRIWREKQEALRQERTGGGCATATERDKPNVTVIQREKPKVRLFANIHKLEKQISSNGQGLSSPSLPPSSLPSLLPPSLHSLVKCDNHLLPQKR